MKPSTLLVFSLLLAAVIAENTNFDYKQHGADWKGDCSNESIYFLNQTQHSNLLSFSTLTHPKSQTLTTSQISKKQKDKSVSSIPPFTLSSVIFPMTLENCTPELLTKIRFPLKDFRSGSGVSPNIELERRKKHTISRFRYKNMIFRFSLRKFMVHPKTSNWQQGCSLKSESRKINFWQM